MARTPGTKIKVRTKIERTISLPTHMKWEDGAKYVLKKKSEWEWALSLDEPDLPPAA